MSTRFVPGEGLPTWPAADPAAEQGPSLDGGLSVELLEQRDDDWALIRCDNGWEAWVDGSLLLAEPPVLAAAVPTSTGGIKPTYLAAAAVVVVAAIVFFAGGGDDQAPSTAGGQPNASASEVPVAVSDEFSEADLAKAVADAQAAPDTALAPASNDEVAAAKIGAALKAAGYDLGPDLLVMPLDEDENLLYFEMGESSPLNNLSDEQGKGFLEALASAPVMAETKVTRLFVKFAGTDSRGPFKASFTARLADLKAAAGGANISSRIGIQVERG